MSFRGSSITRVDEKGRLKIPSDYKREIADKAEFYVTSMDGKRALLYPMAEWEKKEEALAKVPSSNAAKMKFLDVTSYYGQTVELDSAGRLLLPQLLRETAKVDGEVIVLGKTNILEVANHEMYKAERLKSAVTLEDLAELEKYGV